MGANETLLLCPKCGTKTKDPLCPKCGHSFVASGTTIKAALGGLVAGASCILGHDWFGCKCKRCGKVRDEQHTFQPVEGKCEEKCSVCGKTKDIPHTWKGDLWNGKECTLCGSTQKPAYKRGGFWGIVGGVLFAVLITIAIATGVASEKASGPADGIKMPASASDFRRSHFEDVITQLQSAGFINIETTVLDDLVVSRRDGEVERISVNGKTDFRKGSIYAKDAKIVVTYHMFTQTAEGATRAAQQSAASVTAYEAIYNEYAEKIQKATATHGFNELAEIAEEGVEKMTDYYSDHPSTFGDYYKWSQKLMAEYMGEGMNSILDEAFYGLYN